MKTGKPDNIKLVPPKESRSKTPQINAEYLSQYTEYLVIGLKESGDIDIQGSDENLTTIDLYTTLCLIRRKLEDFLISE